MALLKKLKRQRHKEQEKRQKFRSEIVATLLVSSLVVLFVIFSAKLVLPSQKYEAIANRAANWMLERQEADGGFAYEYNPWEDTESKDNNLVRQAAAPFILSEFFKQHPDGVYLEAIFKALDYLEGHTAESVLGTYITDGRKGETGTLALATIACERVRGTLPWNSNYEELCDEYAETLIRQVYADGAGFVSEVVEAGERDFVQNSPYFDGEGWLALAILNQRLKSEEVNEKLELLFDYYSSRYEDLIDRARQGEDVGTDVMSFYLWGMRALDTLDEIKQKDEYKNFAYLMTNYVIEEKRMSNYDYWEDSSLNNCAYLEGIISGYGIAERHNDQEVIERWQPIIEKHLDRLRGFQVGETLTRKKIESGKLTREALPNPEKAVGGFLNSLKEDDQQMRIDYTQHCLGVFILAERYLD